MSAAPDYLIDVGGLHNLRAVESYAAAGGRMRPRRLYRSGAWELVTERGRAWLDSNVKTVIDLRHPDEVNGAASSRRGPPPAGLVAHSIFRADVSMAEFVSELNSLSGDGISSERYLDYLKVGAAARFARAVEMLADESNYPVLVNCTAGKDRTGLLIAMVMDLVGASDEDIGAEYERSNAGIDGLIAYLAGVGLVPQGIDAEVRARMATPAERIRRFLEGVRSEYGSVRDLLGNEGVTETTFKALRERLVD